MEISITHALAIDAAILMRFGRDIKYVEYGKFGHSQTFLLFYREGCQAILFPLRGLKSDEHDIPQAVF